MSMISGGSIEIPLATNGSGQKKVVKRKETTDPGVPDQDGDVPVLVRTVCTRANNNKNVNSNDKKGTSSNNEDVNISITEMSGTS